MNIFDFPEPLTFEWDKGNIEKSLLKHNVSIIECEEAFLQDQKYVQIDELHSKSERRYTLFSRTKDKRPLLVVFTVRVASVRVISARRMHKEEILIYEKKAHTSKI